MAGKILLLHDDCAAPSDVEGLAAAMRARGAEVVVLACAEPYDAVLDAMTRAEKVVYWR
ncbi:MAG: hypothetical protein AB7S87_15135 [Burkholderiales bacterium]